MKKLLLLTALFSIFHSSYAQKASAIWTDKIKREAAHVLYADETATWMLDKGNMGMNNSKYPHLIKVDSVGGVVFDKEIVLPYKLALVQQWAFVNGKILLVYSAVQRETKTTTIEGLIVDMQGNPTGQHKLVENSYTKQAQQYKISIAVSADKTHVAILTSDYMQGYSVRLLDADLRILARSDKAMANINMNDKICVSNKGEAFVVGIKRNTKQDVFSGNSIPAPAEYVLIKYGGESEREFKINAAGNALNWPLTGINSQGDVYVCGFYTAEGAEDYKGTYATVLRAGASELSVTDYKPFEAAHNAELQKQLELAIRDEKNAAFGATDKFLNQVLTINKVCATSTGAYLVSEVLYYNTMARSCFVTLINADGQIGETIEVAKMQSGYDRYLSAYVFTTGNVLHLYYNDKNPDSEGNLDNMAAWNKSVTVLASIDAAGGLIRQVVHHNKDLKSIMDPHSFVQVSDDTIIGLATHTVDNMGALVDFFVVEKVRVN